MATEIIQVRDVPAEDVQTLRARAQSRNMSLSQYLRDLIHESVNRPEMAEVLAQISTRSPIDVDPGAIQEFIEEGRR